jgi:hypothetical protein
MSTNQLNSERESKPCPDDAQDIILLPENVRAVYLAGSECSRRDVCTFTSYQLANGSLVGETFELTYKPRWLVNDQNSLVPVQ